MQNLDSPDVREAEWGPWLSLLTRLHPHRSWDSFCSTLTRNLEALSGAQRIGVFYRDETGESGGWPAAVAPSPTLLPDQVGEVRSEGPVTCAMAYRSTEFSAWLVFVDAGRWNLPQILERVAGPIGQLLARVRSFEEVRTSLDQSLPPVVAAVNPVGAVRIEELTSLVVASAAASKTATLIVVRDATDRLKVCWFDPDDGMRSITPEVTSVVSRLDDSFMTGNEVSLREVVAQQLATAMGGVFSEIDWFYFVPITVGSSVAGLVGAGLPAEPSFLEGVPSLVQDIAAFPRASAKRIRQAQALEFLRVMADELGSRLSAAQLREFALTDGMLRERAHLAIDLHDSVLQDLTYLQLQLGRLDQAMENDPEAAKALLGQLQSQLQMTARETRELAVGLTPTTVSHDLVSSVEAVVERFRGRFDGRVDLRSTGTPRQSPPSINTQAMRIVQEVLNNVWKHAAASRVSVEVRYEPEAIRLVVVDNGRGFVMEERSSGQLGLRGIYERAQEIGGTVDVTSVPAKGTTVTVQIPL